MNYQPLRPIRRVEFLQRVIQLSNLSSDEINLASKMEGAGGKPESFFPEVTTQSRMRGLRCGWLNVWWSLVFGALLCLFNPQMFQHALCSLRDWMAAAYLDFIFKAKMKLSSGLYPPPRRHLPQMQCPHQLNAEPRIAHV